MLSYVSNMKSLSTWLAAISLCGCFGCSIDGTRRASNRPLTTASQVQSRSIATKMIARENLRSADPAVMPAGSFAEAGDSKSSNVVFAIVDKISPNQSVDSSVVAGAGMALNE